MKRSGKIILSACLLSLLVLLPALSARGYWDELKGAEASNQASITIGNWLYDISEYNGNMTVSKDELIMRDGKVFKARIERRAGQAGHDPRDPRYFELLGLRWQITYTESTAEYRSFHHYNVGDYVTKDGKIYQRTLWSHDPVTLLPPLSAPPGGFWREASNVPADQWYRYRIYIEGETVIYNGQRYRCLIQGHNNQEPDRHPAIWQRV